MEQGFHIDLREIEGEGEFLCPTCGAIISPDDESAMAYDILETKTDEDDVLEEIVIQCKACGSTIHVAGFEALAEMESLDYLDDYFIFHVDLESI